jgi:hypothetical protein
MRPAERGAGGRSDRTVVRILGNGYSVNNLWPDVLVDQEPHGLIRHCCLTRSRRLQHPWPRALLYG